MKILITEPGRFSEMSKDVPEVGRYYFLEDADNWRHTLNRAFHALLMVYWRSGVHPKYGGCGYEEFRDQIKRTLGAGFASYVYADIIDGKPKIYHVDSYDKIPEHIRLDPDLKEMVRGKLKSWADYTKKEQQRTVDNLIDDMAANGVNSDKFNEILEGMSERKNVV